MANIRRFVNKAFKNFHITPIVSESTPEHDAAVAFITGEHDCDSTTVCENEMEYAVSEAMYEGFMEGVDWARGVEVAAKLKKMRSNK